MDGYGEYRVTTIRPHWPGDPDAYQGLFDELSDAVEAAKSERDHMQSWIDAEESGEEHNCSWDCVAELPYVIVEGSFEDYPGGTEWDEVECFSCNCPQGGE